MRMLSDDLFETATATANDDATEKAKRAGSRLQTIWGQARLAR